MKKPRDYTQGEKIIHNGKIVEISWITNYCLYFTDGNAVKYEFIKNEKIECKKISRYMREITLNDTTVKIILDFGSMGTSRFYCVEVENKVIQHGFSRLNEAKEYAINYLSKATK